MENNIFEYAKKKEFTQDIAIAWLINCYKYEKTRDIGKKFIEKFIFENKEEVEEVTRDADTQYNKIDVYTEIKTNKDVYSIIFENKEGTFLHGKQLERYIGKIYYELKKNKKNNKIIIILFKSENIFPFEKSEYENQIKECKKRYGNNIIIIDKLRNSEDFFEALEKNTNNSILNLLIDYYNRKNEDNYKNLDWILKKDSKEWNTFRDNIIRKLQNLEKENIIIKCSQNKGDYNNVKGMYRLDFYIEDKEFNETVKKLNNRYLNYYDLTIDLTKNMPIKLFCTISEDGKYRPNNKNNKEEFNEKLKNDKEYENAFNIRRSLARYIKKNLKNLKIEYMKGNDRIRSTGGTIFLIYTEFSGKEIKEDDIVNRIKELRKEIIELINNYINTKEFKEFLN